VVLGRALDRLGQAVAETDGETVAKIACPAKVR
jgi:hypothetical protein